MALLWLACYCQRASSHALSSCQKHNNVCIGLKGVDTPKKYVLPGEWDVSSRAVVWSDR
jgi:hypothetical protein